MIVVLDIPAGGTPDLDALLARLDAAGFGEAAVRAVAPDAYAAALQLLGQCRLSELRHLTLHDLPAAKRAVAGRPVPGPQGEAGRNAIKSV